MKLKELFIKHREVFQLVYGIALIVLIVTLIAGNALYIISRYNKSIEVSLHQMAMTIGNSVEVLLKKDISNPEVLQDKIDELLQKESDFIKIEILEPSAENFNIVASTEASIIGETINFPLYNLAWAKEGVATKSQVYARTLSGEELEVNAEGSYWLVAIPMVGEDGNKQALLTMTISSAKIDEYTKNNLVKSIIFLLIVLFIVISFLLIAVRLWDYALLYKKIREVDQMKDEFISMASHELRTPVTGIRGYVSMILDGTFGEIKQEVRSNLELVQGTTERLAVLVEDLLNVSRIEQGRVKIESKAQDIRPIIESVVAELKVQADEKQLALKYEPQTRGLPSINVDTDRLKQVFINIIGNAIKYTEKGSVEIITEDKGKELEIRIKDTGIGMSTEERERLFEKFYRVQNEKTKTIGGTGLGLWIVKRIVELMKGSIAIDSIKNVGTQVTLQFPIAI